MFLIILPDTTLPSLWLHFPAGPPPRLPAGYLAVTLSRHPSISSGGGGGGGRSSGSSASATSPTTTVAMTKIKQVYSADTPVTDTDTDAGGG